MSLVRSLNEWTSTEKHFSAMMQPMINKWSASSLRLVSTPRALICNKKCTNLCTYLKYTGWSTNFRIHHQHCYIVLLLCFLLLYLLHFTSFNFVVALCSCSSLTISLTLYTTSCLVVWCQFWAILVVLTPSAAW